MILNIFFLLWEFGGLQRTDFGLLAEVFFAKSLPTELKIVISVHVCVCVSVDCHMGEFLADLANGQLS